MIAPARNIFEEARRAQKVLDLSIALDQALTMGGFPLCSAQAIAFVEALDDDGWKTAARNAKCPPPSETTKEMVRDLYRKRAQQDEPCEPTDEDDFDAATDLGFGPLPAEGE